MAFDLVTTRTAVNAKIQDDGGFLSAAEIDEMIFAAMRQVNKDMPRELVVDITGDGTQSYALPAPFDRSPTSDVKTVEVPAGEIPPLFRFRDDDWRIYEDPSKAVGSQLRLIFLTISPAATEIIRVTMEVPYSLTITTTTIDNEIVFRGLILKSVVECFRALAARFAQTTDSSLTADAVDYGGRSQNFLFLSERYETNYRNLIGRGDRGAVKPAQALKEIDIKFAHGEDLLFHRSRTR